MLAGTPADTWRGVPTSAPFSGAGGSRPGAALADPGGPGRDPVTAAYRSRARARGGARPVEARRKAGMAGPAGGPGRGDGLGDRGKAGRESEHRNRPGEGLIRGFPVGPAGARAELVD